MIYLVIIAVILYSLRTLLMLIGSIKEKKRTQNIMQSEYIPFVSVIVPSRNEETNIETCIDSLMKSTYPADKFEIVAIDDRSTDSTPNILKRLTEKYQNVKIITVTEQNRNTNLIGKPGALAAGVEQSSGELLLMTDADCIVNKDWIKTIASTFQDENVGLVASFTLIKGDRVFDIIQAIEWIYLHTMASAGIGLNTPLGCYGNNLTVRRSVYNDLGGYENIPFSVTEDLALLQAVNHSGKKVHYLCDSTATVTTEPCRTFTEYISQHRRWAKGGLKLGWIATAFVITGIAVWSGLIAAILSGKLLWIFAVLFVRLIGDYSLIDSSLGHLGKTVGSARRSFIIPAIIFFMFIELILPFTMLSKKIIWKGQTFTK